MKKRFMVIVSIVMLLLFGSVSSAFSASSGHWAYQNLLALEGCNGLWQGYYEEAPTTRGEFVHMKVSYLFANNQATLAGLPQKSFPDTIGYKYQADVEKLASLLNLVGPGDGNFYPNQPITRAEATTIEMKLCFGGAAIPSPSFCPFPDVSLNYWGVAAIAAAKQTRVVEGNPPGIDSKGQTWNVNFFDPDRLVTVAESATIVRQTCDSWNLRSRFAIGPYTNGWPMTPAAVTGTTSVDIPPANRPVVTNPSTTGNSGVLVPPNSNGVVNLSNPSGNPGTEPPPNSNGVVNPSNPSGTAVVELPPANRPNTTGTTNVVTVDPPPIR